ncbi:hypothetical protein HK096_009944 [Nowakowskiella sp. JEL0078]|nr:hypothetical protein HK096_009944 [Nowakowskiella sp. JEL0078]
MNRLIHCLQTVKVETFKSKIQQNLQISALEAVNKIPTVISQILDDRNSFSQELDWESEIREKIITFNTDTKNKQDSINETMKNSTIFSVIHQTVNLEIQEKVHSTLANTRRETRQREIDMIALIQKYASDQFARCQFLAWFCKEEYHFVRDCMVRIDAVIEELHEVQKDFEKLLKWIDNNDEIAKKSEDRVKMRLIDPLNPVVATVMECATGLQNSDNKANSFVSVDSLITLIHEAKEKVETEKKKITELVNWVEKKYISPRINLETEAMEKVFEFSDTSDLDLAPSLKISGADYFREGKNNHGLHK